MTRRPALLAALVLALPGCGDEPTACPAAFLPEHPNVLVQLADDWPPGRADTLELRCDPACRDGEPGPLTEVLDGGAAWFDVTASTDSVVVTVRDRHGTDLTQLSTTLDRVAVHGPGCGGPMRATVTVPAP